MKKKTTKTARHATKKAAGGTKKVAKKLKKAKIPKKAKKLVRNAESRVAIGVRKSKKAKRTSRKNGLVQKAFVNVEKIKEDFKLLFADISELRKDLTERFSKYFNFGKMTPHQAKISILVTMIVFASFMAIFERYEYLKLAQEPIKQKTVQELKKEALEKKVRDVVRGTPMEAMASYIAEKDEKTAAFLVGIGKKESNWGARKPVLAGKDCFNYWGFRAVRERMGSGGHTCFDNPKDAVDTVAKRIDQIIERNDADSAKKMVVWKCGYSCATHSDESVKKWIKDVDMYAEKILN